MKIDSIKDLTKVIALCRKTGVQSIKIDNVEFHLGALPAKRTTRSIDTDVFPEESIKVPAYTPIGEPEVDKIETEELTEEQLMFYSAVSEPGQEQ